MVARAPIALVSTPRSAWAGEEVFGLGDSLGEARILDKPLHLWRPLDRLVEAEVGATVAGPLLLWGRDLWVSPAMLAAFESAAAALGAAGPVRLSRAASGPAGLSDPLGRLTRSEDGGEIHYDLWYLPAGQRVTLQSPDRWPEALERAQGLDVGGRVFKVEIDVDLTVSETGKMEISFSKVAAAPVGHWVELARANLLAIGAEALEPGLLRGGVSLLWAIVRAMSLNPSKVLQKITRRGKGCWIHPSAVVEGCRLGDNVKVDACAVLRGCVLGDGVKVGPLSTAEFSVFGAGAELQRHAFANLSVIYPGARIGGALQLAVAGRDCRHKFGAIGTDMNPNGPVRVVGPDGLTMVDIGYQGVCLGHGSFVGANLTIMPGRRIEEGRVVASPSRIFIRK